MPNVLYSNISILDCPLTAAVFSKILISKEKYIPQILFLEISQY